MSESQVLQPLQAAAWFVENESENILSILDAIANEPSEVSFVGDLKGHLSPRAGHLEFQIAASLLGSLWEVERDIAEGEAEVDLLVLNAAVAQDRQRLGSHWHGHVHGGNSLEVSHCVLYPAREKHLGKRPPQTVHSDLAL